MTFLDLNSIRKSYQDDIPVIYKLNLSVEKGQVLGLIGESGSGKSTLLRIIAGLENRDKGEVFLEGKRIQNPKEALIPGYLEIQLVHQEYQLYPYSTVEENISRPLLLFDKEYRRKRVRDLLRLLGLEIHKNKLPKQLSGGQQQKVAIGRALSMEPQVLLLDEPFSSLDTIQTRELLMELRAIFNKLNVTVILVTHDLEDALQLSDELVILHQGKIIQKGTPQEVYKKPQNLYTARLFSHLNPVPDNASGWLRPSDVRVLTSSGLRAIVLESVFLPHINQLKIRLEQSGMVWQVEDKARKFKVGDKVFVKYKEEAILSF
jgi:ABC-type glutathione transport system ATPase component